jgi:hypothetical protein
MYVAWLVGLAGVVIIGAVIGAVVGTVLAGVGAALGLGLVAYVLLALRRRNRHRRIPAPPVITTRRRD